MFKLTVVAGPNRGTQYPVQQGETAIGRQNGNAIVLPSSKVSKRHCVLVASDGELIVQDQGSSNGTFVNGILTKSKRVKAGDKISVGEYVLEISSAVQRANRPAPAAGLQGMGQLIPFPGNAMPTPMQQQPMGITPEAAPAAPQDFKGKALAFLDGKIMPVFYGLNFKNEWRVLLFGLVGALVLGNVVLSIYPLLEANRATLIKETGHRARFMARQIAERNAPMLAAKAETKTDIGGIDQADGVRVAVLTDLDLRIIAPASKMNAYLAGGQESVLAAKMRDKFRAGREDGIVVEADSANIVAIEAVKVFSAQAGRNIPVGLAVVSIDTTLSTPDLGEIGVIYSQSLILSGVLGLIVAFILYRLTLKPFQVLNEDIDRALKGEMGQVTHEFKLEELNPLWEVVNSAVQRASSGGGPGGGGAMEASLDDYLGPLKTLGSATRVGILVFDGEKRVAYLNPFFEELAGIRLDGALGQDIASVARDQALIAFVQDLFSRVSPGTEGVTEDFDFAGVQHKVHAAAFGPANGVPKCYWLVVTKPEG